MKQISSILLVATFFVFIQSHAQWNWKHPVPQGNNLNDLYMIDTLGYAVGDFGALLMTPDRGVSWTLVDTLEIKSDLNSLYFTDENTGYIVGDEGMILKTSNRKDWEKIESGIHYGLNSICFADMNTGYIGGYKGLVMKTTDGGDNWETLNSGTLKSIYAISFISVDTGFIVGDSGLIMKTTNAGLSWDFYNSGFYKPYFDISFGTNTKGIITGKDSKILRTTNVGETWVDVSLTTVELDINSVYLVNGTKGFSVGDQGTFFRTGDGGNTWSIIPTNTLLNLSTVFFVDSDIYDTIMVCGQNGIIMESDSSGFNGSWNNLTSANQLSFSSIVYTDDNEGWAIGGDPFYDLPIISYTKHPDSVWETQVFDTIDHYLTDICFIGATGYISGSEGSIYRFHDFDTLKTWLPKFTGTTETLYSVCFLEMNMGYAAGSNGTIIKTISSDTLWAELPTGITDNLYSMFFFNEISGGYAVGGNGTLLKIDDNGNQIIKIYTGTNTPLYDIFFPSDTLGFTVGFDGKIFKIRKFGAAHTIIPIPSGVTTPLNKVYFPSVDTGYIVGDGGVVLKSTDAGNTWYPQYSYTYNNLRDVYFFNSNVGYVVGSGVSILRTENGGGEVILPGVHDQMILPDNIFAVYPNPCTNYTMIEYELFDKGIVHFDLFDLSGRLVKTLFQAHQTNGSYKINVNTSGIPNGVYLVVGKIKNLFQTEKIIVINN